MRSGGTDTHTSIESQPKKRKWPLAVAALSLLGSLQVRMNDADATTSAIPRSDRTPIVSVDAGIDSSSPRPAQRLLNALTFVAPQDQTVPEQVQTRLARDALSLLGCSGFKVYAFTGDEIEVVGGVTAAHCFKQHYSSPIPVFEGGERGQQLVAAVTDVKLSQSTDVAFFGLNGHSSDEAARAYSEALDPPSVNVLEFMGDQMYIAGFPYEQGNDSLQIVKAAGVGYGDVSVQYVTGAEEHRVFRTVANRNPAGSLCTNGISGAQAVSVREDGTMHLLGVVIDSEINSTPEVPFDHLGVYIPTSYGGQLRTRHQAFGDALCDVIAQQPDIQNLVSLPISG